MNTTTTRTRAKLDVLKLIGPLDAPVEPKTLAECLAEAGGFPFAAKAVAEAPASGLPTVGMGEVRTFTDRWNGNITPRPADNAPMFSIAEDDDVAINATIRRWQLLGHRT